jgi:formylglycine-generating enzyme required for sulfatase activity
MMKQFHRAVLITFLFIIVVLFFWLTGLQSTQAAPDAPDYSGSLSTTKAYLTTYQVILTLNGPFDGTPPSAKWYGPSGQVSAGCAGSSNIIREYKYLYGSLVQVIDHFYISSCNREPGQYRVVVGWEIDRTFTIEARTYKVYLPLILIPPAIPQPPTAFSKLTPADETTGLPFNVSLDWDNSDGVDSYTYCYDTSDDDACTNWVNTGTTTKVDLTGLITDTTYYWQVRATNTLGTTYADGASTAFWSFTTGSGSVIPSEMVSIPAGNFQMGCDEAHNASSSCLPYVSPLHTVYLDEYQIDKYEVTNAQYAQCVVAGSCDAPSETSSWDRASYYGNPLYDDYPVIYVTWQDASDYCAWAGKRLPTEAEWEKAARGTSVQTYSWGDTAPTCTLTNYSESFSNQCVGDTNAVGSYPTGASPYDLLDSTGNVWEWVNDWYASDYYPTSPTNNPPGPASGTEKVYRGGGWANMPIDIVVSDRRYDEPDTTRDDLGFRCTLTP